MGRAILLFLVSAFMACYLATFTFICVAQSALIHNGRGGGIILGRKLQRNTSHGLDGLNCCNYWPSEWQLPLMCFDDDECDGGNNNDNKLLESVLRYCKNWIIFQVFIDFYFSSTNFLPVFVRCRLFAAIKDGTFLVCSRNSNGVFDIQVQFREAYSSHRQGNYRTARYFCTRLYNPQELSILKDLGYPWRPISVNKGKRSGTDKPASDKRSNLDFSSYQL